MVVAGALVVTGVMGGDVAGGALADGAMGPFGPTIVGVATVVGAVVGSGEASKVDGGPAVGDPTVVVRGAATTDLDLEAPPHAAPRIAAASAAVTPASRFVAVPMTAETTSPIPERVLAAEGRLIRSTRSATP